MNKIYRFITISAIGASSAMAQAPNPEATPFAGSDILAHWDLTWGDHTNGTWNAWEPGRTFAEDFTADCVTDASMYTLTGNSHDFTNEGHSNVLPGSSSVNGTLWPATGPTGSEGTPDTYCFHGWGSTYDTSMYTSWSVSFGSTATGALTGFNFDSTNNANWGMNVYRDGALVLSDLNNVGDGLTGHEDLNVALAGANFDNIGGSTFEFRYYAWGAEGDGMVDYGETGSYRRIALDNMRVYGSCEHVPEPSASLLCGVSFGLLLLRRRR